MGKYTGKAVTVPFASSVIYQRVSNLSGLQQRLEDLPEEQLKAVGDVNFVDDDNFEIQAPGVGKVNFHIVERTPESRVVFQAETGVVPVEPDHRDRAGWRFVVAVADVDRRGDPHDAASARGRQDAGGRR